MCTMEFQFVSASVIEEVHTIFVVLQNEVFGFLYTIAPKSIVSITKNLTK